MARWTIDHFEKQYNKNYEAAIRYYRDREKNLLNFYAKKAERELTQTELETVEDKMIKSVWDQLNTEFQARSSAVLNFAGPKPYVITRRSKNKKYFRRNMTKKEMMDLAMQYGITYQDLKESFSRGKQTQAQIEGFIKEHFVERQIKKQLYQGQDLVNETIDNLLQDLVQVGSATSPGGGSRPAGAPLSVDVGVGVLQPQQIGQKPKGIPQLEINGNLLIDIQAPVTNIVSKNNNIQALLVDYLNKEDLVQKYGIQIKRFNDSSSFDYRTYTSLKDEILKQFKRGENLSFKKDWEKPWNATYALWFMLAAVSANLYSALGPMLFGVMLGDKFYQASNFVSSFNFRYGMTGASITGGGTMQTAISDPTYSGKEQDIEIHPNIKSAILKAQKNKGSGRLYISSSTLKTQKDKNKKDTSYQKLRVETESLD